MNKIKKIFLLTICCLFVFTLNSCFSDKEKVTNNTINNKVINVQDYTINDLEDAVMIASEKAEQSVIAIMESNLASTSTGSAVVVKRQAYSNGVKVNDDNPHITNYEYLAVTNNHVVDGLLSINYKVFLSEKITDASYQTTDIVIVEKDASLDLALIKFSSKMFLKTASLGNSNELKKGQIVIAIGTPMSLEFFNTVTYGIVSHPYRYSTVGETAGYYVQHDAAINPGNSGGGLFDLEGKLIGINTWKLLDAEDIVVGMNFAIPSSIVYTRFKTYLD